MNERRKKERKEKEKEGEGVGRPATASAGGAVAGEWLRVRDPPREGEEWWSWGVIG